jgi:hypothetical protein
MRTISVDVPRWMNLLAAVSSFTTIAIRMHVDPSASSGSTRAESAITASALARTMDQNRKTIPDGLPTAV